jgi:hypothetical protein
MGTMKTRYLKTGRHNFSATLDIYGDGDHAVLTCWHRESKSDPCAGQNQVVGIARGLIPRTWRIARHGETGYHRHGHSGGRCSVALVRQD